MEGIQKIFSNFVFIIIFIILFLAALVYKNVIFEIILLFLLFISFFLLTLDFKYYSYFKISKPKKWSEIKCNKCNYQGKPLHLVPRYIPLLSLGKQIDYDIRYYPIEYACPNCKNPRKNYKNIKFIEK